MKKIEFVTKPIDKMNEDEVHYLIKYTDGVNANFINTANLMYEKANQSLQDLSAQLMLITTVMLTGSLIALGNEELLKVLSIPLRWLIVSIFLLQVMSVLSGIFAYKQRERFFATSADVAADTGKMVKAREYKDLDEMDASIENMARTEEASKETALHAQIYCLGISLVIFFVFIVGVLFDIPGYTPPMP